MQHMVIITKIINIPSTAKIAPEIIFLKKLIILLFLSFILDSSALYHSQVTITWAKSLLTYELNYKVPTNVSICGFGN